MSSSSSSSQKHSNLLAAKSALGIADAPSSASASSSQKESRISSGTSVLSRDSRGSTISVAASGVTTISEGIGSSATSGARDKKSTLHDLSASARLEARRLSQEESLEGRAAQLNARGSFNSEERRRRSALGSAVAPSPASPLRAAPVRQDSTPSVASSANDTWTLEEGSRDDSMAAWTRNSYDTNPAVGVQSVAGRSAVSSRNSTPRSSLTRPDQIQESSEMNISSSNFGMSSSFNNVYEKKVSFDNRGQPRRMDAVDEHTFDDSGTFDSSVDNTLNDSVMGYHNKKVSFNEGEDDVRIVERRGSRPPPVSSFESDGKDFEENDEFEGSDAYNESETSSQFNDAQIQDYGASQQSLVSTGSQFVPQRFDEMRSLLLNITPLQLEALVHEIFSNSPSAGSYLSVNSASDNSRIIPPEWKGIRKKSKRYRFRKDAYLGEMSFEELQNFAQSIELWSIVDNEGCNDFEEAMDIFAIEFEMLVSGYKASESTVNSGSQQQMQLEDDLQSYMSSNSQDEGENLRRSLRACSVPELRLVAERLNLDLSECDSSKANLIMLIERSMPDMLNNSSRSGSSYRPHPPPPPPRDYLDRRASTGSHGDNAAMYVEESHAQRQQEELESDRSRKVKFSTDCKEDTSHLIPKREVNQSVWGNYVVGPGDIENNGDDSQPLMYDDNGDYDRNDEHKKSREGLKWPEQRKKFIVVGTFVSILVGVALGLGLGLTKDQRQGGGSPTSSNIITGPWNIGFDDSVGTSDMPSASPTKRVPPDAEKEQSVVVILDSAPSKKPTNKPTLKPTVVETGAPSKQPLISEPYNSGVISSIEIMTNSPSIDSVDNDGEDFTADDLSMPYSTIAPGDEYSSIEVPILDNGGENITTNDLPTSNSTTTETPVSTNAPTILVSSSPTIQPTNVGTTPLYPLQGPFEEEGMRMILYGVSELSSMGQTQWKMLTSAFMEQFYNHGEKGDDAIQNIVLELSAEIEITDDKELTADGRRRLEDAYVITFTTTISYRTLSAFIDAATVVDRPFFDEGMRSNYISYLMTNNGVTYIGNVTSISEIFRGDDVPAEYLPDKSEVEYTDTESPNSSSIQSPMPSAAENTPVPSSLGTPEPSIEIISVLTPRPTLSTGSNTPRPTQNSFDFDFVGNTLSPVSSPDGATFSTLNPTLSFSPTIGDIVHTFSPVGGGLDTPFPTSNAFDWPGENLTPATNSIVYTDSPTEIPTPKPSKKERTPPPLSTHPTKSPSQPPTTDPTKLPTHSPTPSPTPSPSSAPTLCDLVEGKCNDEMTEVLWAGYFEIAQTHVVKAVGETRRAPRMIAQREAEILFTPSDSRRLQSDEAALEMETPQRIESVGKAYFLNEKLSPLNDAAIDALLDGTDSLISVLSPNAHIVIDLKHIRVVQNISLVLPEGMSIEDVQVGLRYDDGQNSEEEEFHYPNNGWLWHDLGSSTLYVGTAISVSFPNTKTRYISLKLRGGYSQTSDSWSLQRVEIVGYFDLNRGHTITPKISARSVDPRGAARVFVPSKTTAVHVAVYSASGRLLGVINGRDPSGQRKIFESQVSEIDIDPYSKAAWSVTIPYDWVQEGNVVVIGCIDRSRPNEVLTHRLELEGLAQFSEHSITRTKLAIFGSDEDLSKLNPTTFPGRKLARNLKAVIPVSELKWSDTDLWHLPYLVVISKDGSPAIVTSEEERRLVTGIGTEVQWEVVKNFLTIRHALAQAGLGLAMTDQEGNNSPYASHTSVFMGWSLSKQDDDGLWHWEDLGYWDTLAAAAWTGWVVLKAGDECSNYFIHELGHSQSMQHFDNGAAKSWDIEDEYPEDGVYTEFLPWGFDSVTRQFRTWFDPLDGSGKKDPLNGEGEPPYSQELNCFSQYTPYQAMIAQEWAMSTPVLLSASSSGVPRDGAYQFNAATKQYVPLSEAELVNAAGEHASMPDQVSVPVVTLIGTIGASRDVCQTYPALRGYGNTFKLPDPFDTGLSSAFDGASYFVEVRFESGSKVRGLIAVKDVSKLSLYSFNVAIDQRPIAVDLYRFVDGSYPNLSSSTQTQLLHIRPIDLSSEDPLQGMSRQLRVGRGWMGDSSTPVIDSFCMSLGDCQSDRHHIEWRGDVGSDHVVYRSTLQGKNDGDLGVTIFKVPARRDKDSTEYTITVLASRYFNDLQGMSPLLTSEPVAGEGSSSIDVTHLVRIWAPWDLNDSLPVGMYRTLPGSFKISADAMGSASNTFRHNIIEFNVVCYIHTVTAAPTFAPTKRPSEGPSRSPIEVRYHIDWKHGTCVTEGESSSWAPPHNTKEECCKAHMNYEYNVCLSRES